MIPSFQQNFHSYQYHVFIDSFFFPFFYRKSKRLKIKVSTAMQIDTPQESDVVKKTIDDDRRLYIQVRKFSISIINIINIIYLV